jgi:hypothetical protein
LLILAWAGLMLAGAFPASAEVRLGERREQPIAGPVLALAWVDESRLLVLGSRELSLVAWRGGALERLDAFDLPPATVRVRVEAGLLVLDEAGGTAWVTTNRIDHSALVAIEGERLTLRSEALAMPWPGSAAGLRFQEGTNILTGTPPAWEGTALLAFTPNAADLAVSTSGELLSLGPEGPRPAAKMRVGPTLAPLATGLMAVSSARVPGAGDEVSILMRGESGWSVATGLPIDGAVRAIAAHAFGRRFRLACAVESGERLPWRLILLDVDIEAP